MSRSRYWARCSYMALSKSKGAVLSSKRPCPGVTS
jgi:hypothetical protein